MTITKDNFRTGACQVIFNSVDLGATSGGVEITITGSAREKVCDQYGEVVINEVITGRKATVKVPLMEAQIDQLKNVFGDWTISGTTSKKVSFSLGVGTDLYSKSGTLILKRLADPTTPETSQHEWYTFPNACPFGPLTEKMSWGNEVVYEVEFKIFPDLANNILGYRGYSTPA